VIAAWFLMGSGLEGSQPSGVQRTSFRIETDGKPLDGPTVRALRGVFDERSDRDEVGVDLAHPVCLSRGVAGLLR
jgi:hypothetical protein